MQIFKLIICGFLALFFIAAGIMHFVNDDSFAAIVPPILPFKYPIVWATGVMELVFALGLLLPKYRQKTGVWLSVYLLAVLPANIYMAIAGISFGDITSTKPQLWGRVAMQFPLIALILWASRDAKAQTQMQ